MKRILTQQDALLRAQKGLEQHLSLLTSDHAEGNLWFADGDEARAEQELQDYRDTIDIIQQMITEHDEDMDEFSTQLADILEGSDV